MSGMRCYYEVLELERDCSAEEIKKHYRKLALQWHPDKNVGNEELATKNFKEITTAHAVLINPQERKWYDDHRDNILSGGDGTAKSGEGGDDPEENLWPFFNAMCFKGFHDGSDGFYGVYRGVFIKLHEDEVQNGSVKAAAPVYSFGSKEFVAKEVLDFYSHWSNFVTTMSFGWADVYDVREAPNRIVKRAIEKENKKARDEAKRKYQDKVRALVAFVKGMDPRVMKIEADRRKRKAEEDAQRAEQKAAELVAKKELRLRRQKQLENDDEERERREKERSRAYLLADNDDEYDQLHRAATPTEEEEPAEGDNATESKELAIEQRGATATVPKGDKVCYAFLKGSCTRGSECGFKHEKEEAPVSVTEMDLQELEEALALAAAEEEVGEEEEEFVVLRCEICRKDFKSEPQLEQHFTSKNHRKKEAELAKKGKLPPPSKPAAVVEEDAVVEEQVEVIAPVGGLSKKALKKKKQKQQVFAVVKPSDEEGEGGEGAEPVAAAAVTTGGFGGGHHYDSSSSED